MRADPHNHCAPLLDVLNPVPSDNGAYLIFPTIREFNDPDFETLGEILDFIKQILEVSLQPFSHTANVLSARKGPRLHA